MFPFLGWNIDWGIDCGDNTWNQSGTGYLWPFNNSLPEPNISWKQLFSCSLCRWNATCMTYLMSLKRTICQEKAKASISYESCAVAYLITVFIPHAISVIRRRFFSRVKTRRRAIHNGVKAVPSEQHWIAFPAGAINRCSERKNTIRKTNGAPHPPDSQASCDLQGFEREMRTWRHNNQWCRLMVKYMETPLVSSCSDLHVMKQFSINRCLQMFVLLI